MNRFIVVDFETTGSQPRQGDKIIQIGAVAIDDGQIVESFSTLVNPEQPIPPFITLLTGITDEMVASAPTLEEVLPQFLRILDGRTFVAHNAQFDLHFMQEALQSQGYYAYDGYVLDTVELARFLMPMQGSYRLGELAGELDIEHDRPHQADSDALATGQLFLRLLDILQKLPLVTLQRLQMLVSSFRTDLSVLLRHLEMEKLSSSAFAESERSSATIQEEKDAWDIYRQIALRRRDLQNVEPEAAVPFIPVNRELQLNELTGAQEGLAQTVEGYQPREAQEAMIRAIYDAMNDGSHLLVEAGTGTGKSLAYLLPSVFWAKQNGQQVIISTHTIQLQEQLIEKEIPNLQNSLPFSFTAAKLKGRGNYLCLRKFEQSLDESLEGSSQEMKLVKGQMLSWLTQTLTGDVEELSLPSAGSLFWQQVKSDTNSCLHRKCPWFSRCYYFQAKEASRDADLLIVNHALFLSDLQADKRILPAYQVAVIDEAHHLEESATQQMGVQYSTVQLHHLADRLTLDQGSLIAEFTTELSQWNPDIAELAREKLQPLSKLHVRLREDLQQWTQLLYHWAVKRGEETTDVGRYTVRYHKAMFTGRKDRILTSCEKMIARMIELAGEIDPLLGLAANGDSPPSTLRSIATDLRGLLDDLQKAANQLHFLLLNEDDDYVFWMEVESRTPRKHVFLFAAPLEVADALGSQLFQEKQSVILTSATLTVKGSFDYLLERYGLNQLPADRVRTLSLPSPFDYEEQGLMLIPSDFPALGKDGEDQYLQAVIQGCIDVIRASAGRTLILFTSHSMLRQVYQGMKDQLSEEEFTLLGHGVDSNNRSKLVRMFQSSPRAVLFGTSSFWEGVDIRGEALSSLVIVRLPFTPPNHPVTEGRAEKMKAEKKNPFMSLALPQAIIQFKQGVGRLIRHHQDKGVIVVFDTRIVESRYGRSFLKSLPPYRIETGPWTQLREKIEPFVSGMPASLDT